MLTRAAIATVLAEPPIAPIASREDLIDALGRAAELEHAIMCQYLYAAFSLDFTAPELAPEDSETVRGFMAQLLLIARQEMEHLGIVSNLLIAVGAPPNFDRPNLPIPPFYYQLELPLALLPFGDVFLREADRLEAPCAEPEPHPPLPYYPSIAAVYDRIRDGLATLGAPGAPTAATLFLGAGDPQLTNASFGATPNQVWYDIELLGVTDYASAVAAIDLIRVQGEGSRRGDADSHYGRVAAIRAAWDAMPEAARAAAVRPVPVNPMTSDRGDVDRHAPRCVLRDPRAVALARLGSRAYELMLLMLARQYGANDATPADRDMYRDVAFFPLMTAVVRPVAQILAELPAGDGAHAAAFTFELDGPIRTYPDRATFHVQIVERLTHLADGFAALAADDTMPPRLGFVAKNVGYLRRRLVDYVAANPTGATPPAAARATEEGR